MKNKGFIRAFMVSLLATWFMTGAPASSYESWRPPVETVTFEWPKTGLALQTFSRMDCAVQSAVGSPLERTALWAYGGGSDREHPAPRKDFEYWTINASYLHRDGNTVRRIRTSVRRRRGESYQEILDDEPDIFQAGGYEGPVCEQESCGVISLSRSAIELTHGVASVMNLYYLSTGVELMVWQLREDDDSPESPYRRDRNWLPLTDRIAQAAIDNLAQEKIDAPCTAPASPLLECTYRQYDWSCHEIPR